MTLMVIGAGMGRTGTYSLKLALGMLGFGPCHHMTEVIGNEAQKAFWRAAGRGEAVDWEQGYAGYRSAVDWPTAHFWRELSAYYPDARVILTTRDPGAWYASVANTISRGFGAEGNDPATFGVAVIGNTVFGGRFGDRAHAIAVYEAHNRAVRETIPPARRLDYEAGQGWEPLCDFLGVPVPAEAYPHRNSTEEFLSRQRS